MTALARSLTAVRLREGLLEARHDLGGRARRARVREDVRRKFGGGKGRCVWSAVSVHDGEDVDKVVGAERLLRSRSRGVERRVARTHAERHGGVRAQRRVHWVRAGGPVCAGVGRTRARARAIASASA